jgi:hypothetical protein
MDRLKQPKPDTIPDIKYGITRLSDIEILTESVPMNNGKIKVVPANVVIDNEQYGFSNRFGTSLCSQYGLSPSIFQLFSYDEVFERLLATDTTKGHNVRYAVDSDGKLLGLSSVNKNVIDSDTVKSVIGMKKPWNIRYGNGVVELIFNANINDKVYGGEDFGFTYSISIPIDGYGNASSNVGWLRFICSNGAIAISTVLRNIISVPNAKKNNIIGANMSTHLLRYVENFNDSDGFEVLKQRLESSVTTPASIDEIRKAVKVIDRTGAFKSGNEEKGTDGTLLPTTIAHETIKTLADNVNMTYYGLSSYDEVSEKKRKLLPTKMTTHDLMNFMSEYGTHKLNNADDKRVVDAFLGELIANEYDLEGTLSTNEQPADLFLQNIPSTN